MKRKILKRIHSLIPALAMIALSFQVNITPVYADDGGIADPTINMAAEKQDVVIDNLELDDKTYDGQSCSDPIYDLVDADGGAVPAGTITIEYQQTENASGEAVEDAEWTTEKPVQAGTYTVKVTREADADYEEAQASAAFTISQRILEAEVTAEEKVYDASTDVVLQASVDTGVEGESLVITSMKGAFTDPDAGENKEIVIQPNLEIEEGDNTDFANYAVAFPTSISTGKILKKDISGGIVTLGDLITESGSTQTQIVESVTIDGLTVTYDVTGNSADEAGTYTMVISGNGNFTGSIEQSWVIAAADDGSDESEEVSVKTSPQTGDDASPMIWFMLLLASGAGAAAAVIRQKKKAAE